MGFGTETGWPMNIRNENNRVGRLVAANELDEAERVLGEIERELAKRPLAVASADDLQPAFDEYFYRCHRARVGWLRRAYEAALPDADRAYELENAIFAAARERGVRELADFAFASGAWSIVSMLTGCKRFDDAERVFASIVGDERFFWARRRHDAEATEKLLIACLCIYWERGGDEAFASGRDLVRRAQELASPDGAELAYGYASFWARAGDADRALDAIETSHRRGYDLEKALEDDDMKPLRGHPRWETAVIDRVLTCMIDSDPPGARIWIDGVDTGRHTPAKLRPLEPGMHLIRFILDGHAGETVQTYQSSRGAGLSLRTVLVSNAELAEKARMIEDGARGPDEAARARTRAFLGDVRHATAVVSRDTTYGLGGVTIAVHGDGRTEIHKEGWGWRWGSKVNVRIGAAETAAVFDAFVEQAFTEMVIAPHAGVPDELYFTIGLSGAGGTHELAKFVSAEHARFTSLLETVFGVVRKRVGRLRALRLTI